MNHDKCMRESNKWMRLASSFHDIATRTPEEARAYQALSPKQKQRYSSRMRNWIDGKTKGPMPQIPGCKRSKRPKGDASRADETDSSVS